MPVLLLVYLMMENSGASDQYVVTCAPNWNHIYIGDSVTLKCDMGPSKNDVYWYKDYQEINQHKGEFTISKAKSTDTGAYECWTGIGDRSHPLMLYVIEKDIKDRLTVNFNPNYQNIFVGEKIDISCEDGSSASHNQRYLWYKNNVKLENHQQSITIEKAKTDNSGSYKCEKGDDASFPVTLHVHPVYYEVILQTPPNILEGDSLDLRCHSYNNKEVAATFFKDDAIIQDSNQILNLPNVKKSSTGTYRCEKTSQEGTEEKFIFVQDLFTSPKIEAPPYINKGEAKNLTCDTRRNPLREDTELKFAFYRNRHKVQEFGSSHIYQVRSAQGKDSGAYTCEVRTLLDTVMKMSDASYINIKDPISGVNIVTDEEDRTIQWSMLGILVLIIVLVVGLLLMYRKKIMSVRCCQKKPPSSEETTVQNGKDVDMLSTTSNSEDVYANMLPTNNVDDDDGDKNYTHCPVQAPSLPSAAATREDFMVLCSMITERDQKIPRTSDSSDIYENFTTDNIIYNR